MSDGKDHLWMAITVGVLEIFLSLCPGLKIRHKYWGKKKKCFPPPQVMFIQFLLFLEESCWRQMWLRRKVVPPHHFEKPPISQMHAFSLSACQ